MRKVKNIFILSDWLKISAIIVFGCIFFPFGTGWRELGFGIIACAIFIAPFIRHGYKIEGENGVFKLLELQVQRNNKELIEKYLGSEEEIISFSPSPAGGALILLYYSVNNAKYFAQFFDYQLQLEGKQCLLQEVSRKKFQELKDIFAK